MPRFFVDPDIAKAKTLDTAFYTDARIFEESKEKLFASSWQFAGDIDLVKEAGQVHPFTLLENFLDEPLMLSRDKNGALHCLSNVCTHRGNLLINEPCKAANIRCRYHGRIFQLNGQFHSMPEFKEVLNFPSEEDNLRQLELFRWGKWLFTSLNQNSKAQDFFRPMMRRLDWLPLDQFVLHKDRSRIFTVNAHWALYCENYLEGFHIPFVHAGLNAVIDYGNYTTELYERSSLQLGIAKDGEDVFELPTGSLDYGKNIAAYYYFVFPNMMFNFYPWGLSVNIVQPLSLDKTNILFLTYVWKEDAYNKGAGSNLDTVELEDEEVVENVQRGIRSRFYKHGRYSVSREQGTHHFHRLIAELM
jgi:choline monooxygenase